MNKAFTTILTNQAHTNNSRQNQWKAYRASRTITAIKKKADKNTVITKSNKKSAPFFIIDAAKFLAIKLYSLPKDTVNIQTFIFFYRKSLLYF